MPYRSDGGRRNNVQIGVGHSVWGGSPPPPIPERILDGIPGCLAWVALLFSIAAAIAFPNLLLLIAAVLAFYSALRFLFAGIATAMGLRFIHEAESIDWKARYDQEATDTALAWDDVHHIVIVPNYKEPVPILMHTLEALSQQYEARQRMTIVLAMEATEPEAVRKAEQLQKLYEHRFAHLFFTVHPAGLPGEMQCKSANLSWAARWVKRRLVDEHGYDIDHISITTMDADTQWHRRYFEALTYKFAINPNRYELVWQAPIRYHANIWDVNPLVVLVNVYSTAFELAYLAAPWWSAIPMSSYTLSLRLLVTSGYWDGDVIADESHMYIKAFFAREGEVNLEPIFLPFLAYATSGDGLWDAIKNRYMQTLRHAWGSKEMGYIIAKMLEHPEMDITPAFKLLLRVAHDILLAGAGWVILTLGAQLPILLNPQIMPQNPDGSPLGLINQLANDPRLLLLELSFLVFTIVSILVWYMDLKVRPPRTHSNSWKERLLTLLSFPLLPILTLIVVALPTLQAQTKLLVGIPLQFRVTRK